MTTTSEPILENLMVALQRGDQDAGRELFTAGRALATLQASRILRSSGIVDRAIVEDVVQETLLAIFEKRHTYDPSQPFLPWLFAITKYKVIDQLRRGRARLTTGLDNISEDQKAVSTSPEVAIDLERLLETLPVRTRRAVEMVKLEGMSHGEAAEQMGVGEGALKVLVHRALKRLKASLLVNYQTDQEGL